MHAFIKKFEVYLLTEKRVSLNTYKAYTKDCLQYADFLLSAGIPFMESSEDHLRQFLDSIHRTISTKSLCRKIAAIKLFFSYCAEFHNIENKCATIHFPSIPKTLPSFCTESEIKVLFDACSRETKRDYRTYIFLLLLYNAGIRVSELCRLTVSDIDWFRATLRVHGKGGKMRLIPLPIPVIEELKNYFDFAEPSHYIFPIKYGKKIKPISRQSVGAAIKNLVIRAALQNNISPHSLRHSLATHLLKSGWDLRSLQLLLGHEQISTVQLYTHLNKSDLIRVYNKTHPRA